MARKSRTNPSPSRTRSSSENPSSPLAGAKSDAYRLISRRTRTRKNIQDRLRQRGHSEDVIQQTLESLSELGYVDDAAFAREWCRYRLESRPLGARALQQELFQKGIRPQLAETAVREAFEQVSEAELAKNLAERRLGKGSGLQTPKDIQRLRDFLLRRGFSVDAVRDALSSANLLMDSEFAHSDSPPQSNSLQTTFSTSPWENNPENEPHEA